MKHHRSNHEKATYIKDNEEDDIHAVEYEENPEKPPSCSSGKEESEAPSGVIEQESEFLPYATAPAPNLGCCPDHQS